MSGPDRTPKFAGQVRFNNMESATVQQAAVVPSQSFIRLPKSRPPPAFHVNNHAQPLGAKCLFHTPSKSEKRKTKKNHLHFRLFACLVSIVSFSCLVYSWGFGDLALYFIRCFLGYTSPWWSCFIIFFVAREVNYRSFRTRSTQFNYSLKMWSQIIVIVCL